jgi:hypothetical protein
MRRFPLPNSPRAVLPVDVNTETGHEFIDRSRECGTTPLDLLVTRSAAPLGDSGPETPKTSGRALGAAPSQRQYVRTVTKKNANVLNPSKP